MPSVWPVAQPLQRRRGGEAVDEVEAEVRGDARGDCRHTGGATPSSGSSTRLAAHTPRPSAAPVGTIRGGSSPRAVTRPSATPHEVPYSQCIAWLSGSRSRRRTLRPNTPSSRRRPTLPGASLGCAAVSE